MYNNDDDISEVIIGIIIVIIIGWCFFASAGNQSVDRGSDPQTYYGSKGYECTDDCSGHDAGYEWASDNDVCDASYSDGNSNSFDEGVRAYAEDNCN